jgi:hypothetical protein
MTNQQIRQENPNYNSVTEIPPAQGTYAGVKKQKGEKVS